MLRFDSRNPGRRRSLLAGVIFGVNLMCATMLMAQLTPGSAGIRGMVMDQNAAPVASAKVTITNKATGLVVQVMTSSAGVYSSGPIPAGEYLVRVEAKGFKKNDLAVFARVAAITAGDFKLQPGAETEVIAAQAADATPVNTEQPTVQSVLLPSQMNLLPVGGRNVLDLAQLAPGVQLQDGGVIDPGKNGFSSISFLSRYGRATRIEVDGASISDEVVGTTTQNIAASAILEFNLSQSSLDLPTESISSGAVNIATRAGSNSLHGEAFGVFRGDQGAAALPGSTAQSFQRQQYGGRVGGPFIKDKFFWFLDGERTKQDVTAFENFAAPFDSLRTKVSQPFRDLQADGRLDWQGEHGARAFYRFSFDQVGQIRPFGATSSLQAISTATHTPSNAFGYDFTKGAYTHSIRVGYLRMRSEVGDNVAVIPAGPGNPIPGVGINIGAPVGGSCAESESGAFCGGPSAFAPKLSYQSNIESRYDGTRVLSHHVFRYGVGFNRIEAGGFAALYSSPQVGVINLCLSGSTQTNCLTSADPTAYAADFAVLGNGLPFSTARSAFGYRGGGLGPDNQIEAYVGDGWKITHNLTLTYGLRYLRDTGRVDSGLGSLSILNQWVPGLSNPVRQPNFDFAPQFGFAWNVGGNGTTVIRGGGGLYYDTTLWSNALPDNRARATQGSFSYTPQVCTFGNAVPFVWPSSVAGLPVNTPVAGGSAIVTNPVANQVAPTFCGTAISTAGNQILALSSAFQAAAAANGATQANPNFVGTALSAVNANGVDLFAPDYLTPRSIQLNLGFQHEIHPGMVFSVDYVRNIGEHNLLVLDANHSGAARSYNFLNAIAARNKVESSVGCLAALGEAQCVINRLGSVAAAQAAFSAAGLDSNSATTGGGPCSFCAFPGVTPVGLNRNVGGGGNGSLGTLDLMSTIGRSVYSGWQAKLVQRFASPVHGIKAANIQVAYSYSKFESQDQDQDLASVATNNDNPRQFTGPNGLDRKHQVSLSGTMELPWYTKLSFIGHFYSPLAQTLRMPELTSGGEIFATDWIGSGLGSGAPAEPVKGTQIGQFMRGTNLSNLQHVISLYNTNFAGTLTPGGHCLVADQGCPGAAPIPVMTMQDMTALGWVMPSLPSIPFGAVGSPWLKTFDLRAAWPITIREGISIEPSASVFNVFNFANSFMPGNLPNGSLLPGPNPTLVPNGALAPNVVGGVTGAGLTPYRAGFQSGTYALGAPRQLEFGLRISF
jgi:Carboxypeptidase regulatory-like domain